MKTKTKSQTQNPTQNAKQAKHARVNKTYGAAQMERLERFGNYILSLDGASGGYTYGEDWSGDDLRALCDIFGA